MGIFESNLVLKSPVDFYRKMTDTEFTVISGYATKFRDIKEGSGQKTVSKNDTVTVHATGIVKETNKKFWSTKDPGQKPFTYKAGVGKVITGWDQGCLGMKKGGERELIIPAKE